ncbi:hypothetical protein LCGC14_1682390 [marine sediment metagenome]|uniref:Uncharacterized protein n=1 Tax=marine sediment metagenome TaxID=412755 RepID=A0A0F9HNB7_9ZZZZ
MSKVFICRECGFALPNDLSHLIEQKIQVYCERCGSPFILEGVKFKPAPTPFKGKIKRIHTLFEKNESTLEKSIQFLNKISFLPLFIYACISFGLIAEIAFSWDNWINILIKRSLLGLISSILLVYDKAYIATKVREKKYNEIFVHSLCWGILGSIFYGLGVIILIKGVLIIFYVISNPENKDLRAYDYGLITKNSLNDFSAKAGFLIILFGIFRIFTSGIYSPRSGSIVKIIDFPLYIGIFLTYSVLLFLAIVALIIDLKLKNKISEKREFKFQDSIKILILGVIGTLFYAAGIFVLLTGSLIFFLALGKPSEKIQITPEEEKLARYIPSQRERETPQKRFPEEEEIKKQEVEKPIISQSNYDYDEETKVKMEKDVKEQIHQLVKEEKSVEKILEEIPVKKEKEKKEREFELKLHDSLLPVKNEKDKKLVKEYFSKIFTVLSKNLRKQIIDLKISKKEKRELLQELLFLTKEEQAKYIASLIDLYREIPKKLISKIRKLPNVKPKHYDKILAQLKYMDVDDQLKYVQFLEENA